MVVLNNRNCQGKLWLPKTCPKNHLKTILSQKTVYKRIGTTLPRLKIHSKKPKDTSGVDLSIDIYLGIGNQAR